jgi:stringent starvation protein B
VSGEPSPPKKDVARALLLRGSVFVHLDPRIDGVIVPEWLADQPQVVLQVGLDMPIPITDLRVDDAGVSGTLSFQRAPFTCTVPWEAVFAIAGDDGRGMVWPESMPEEIRAEVEREAGRRAAPVPVAALAEIDDEDDEDEELVDNDGVAEVVPLRRASKATSKGTERSDAPRRKRRTIPPYLRVIK